MRHVQAFHWMVVGTLIAAACEDGGERGVGTDEPRSYAYTCPSWRCGLNSAEVNGHSLQELNLDGVANEAGARFISAVPPLGVLGYTFKVEGDEFVLRSGASVLRGAQLIGTIVVVELPGGATVPVTIAGYDEVDSWADGRPPIAAYTLLYPEPQEILGVENVCSGDLLDPLASVVTVLGGERYDEATKTVVAGQARWFTLACRGSAAAKLKLLGYGPQSSATTPAQRQATLKMITADYCGGGESYTENGTPILWANADGSVTPGDGVAPGDVEAVWDENGARCLGSTRIPDIEVMCQLPPCAGYGFAQGEWITAVPAE